MYLPAPLKWLVAQEQLKTGRLDLNDEESDVSPSGKNACPEMPPNLEVIAV